MKKKQDNSEKKKSPPQKHGEEPDSEIRLQKFISRSGVASRRKAEELIREGGVTVNGKTIRELGTKVNPSKDRVQVDGIRIKPVKKTITVLLNKPKGYLCTLSDPEKRPLITDLVQGLGKRIYPVGRLDFNTEGLILLTNDGDLAYHLTRTANKIPKTYFVKVSGTPNSQTIEKLRRGVHLEEGLTLPAEIILLNKTRSGNGWFSVTLVEGKNRQIHRMFRATGHLVSKIKRVRFGPLELGDLPIGQYRILSEDEVTILKKPG